MRPVVQRLAAAVGVVPALSVLVAAGLVASGCGDAQRLLDKVKGYKDEDQAYTPVPGDRAEKFLQPVLGDVKQDVASTLEAMSLAQNDAAKANLTEAGLADTTDQPTEVSTGAADSLTSTQKAKKSFASKDFKLDPGDTLVRKALGLTHAAPFTMLADTVTWSGSDTQFTVSVLERMPVRDQGQRGTCGSHAAIGQIEGLILKQNASLGSIDLAEQRFYYMSKPEAWSNGGDVNQQGSDPGTGMGKSAGTEYQGVTYPPDSPSDFNIPLESDCPYNGAVGSNDLQTPQATGCRNNGVVKVKDYAAWLHQFDKWLTTPQQIYDWLRTRDYPVVVYTKLSSNWEDNDGIITLKAAGDPGSSPHAAGHAYMVVGARKLDEAKFPGEGGMCFVIRNSWGTGWGTNGTSCMTLAWFNKWRFDDGFAQTFDVDVDSTKIATAKAAQKTVPANTTPPDPGTKGSQDNAFGGLTKKKGELHVGLVAEEAAPELTATTTTADGFTVGTLLASDSNTYKMLYKVDGTKVTTRGMLKGDAKLTNDLVFGLAESKYLTFPVDGRGDVRFGELDQTTGLVTLCSKTYAEVCDLNYQSTWNELVTGLTEAEARREEPTEPFDWKGFDVGGYGLQVSLPSGSHSRVDLRFLVAGKATNPQRFAVDLLNGGVSYKGESVGDYQKGALCSGDFKDLCRIVVAGDKFNVLFKAKKK